MTDYDMLTDAIIDQMYTVWKNREIWNEEDAKRMAHKILEIVEEYQTKAIKPTRWRASD